MKRAKPTSASTSASADSGRLTKTIARLQQEIADLKTAVTVLREEEDRYRRALIQADTVVYQRDYSKEQFLFVGENIQSLTGYSPAEFTTTLLDEIILETVMRGEATGLILAEATPYYRSGKFNHWQADYQIRCKNGELRWFNDSSIELVNKQKRRIGSLGILRDITDRKRAEDQIRLLTDAVQSVQDCISITDLQNNFIYVNQAFEQTYGFAHQELFGKNMALINGYFMPNQTGKDISTETLEKGYWQGELINKRKDGSLFPIWLSTSIIRNSDNQPIGLIGIARDITVQKQAEQQLLEDESRYRAVIEQAIEGIYIVDFVSKRYLEVNPAYCNLLGYTAAEMRTLTLYDIVAHNRDSIDQYCQQIREQRQLFLGERNHRRKDGTLITFEINVTMITYGEQEAICVVVRDIAARKQAEELARKKQEQVFQYQSALLQLAKTSYPDLNTALQQITQLDAQTLGVERVSVWFYTPDRTEIICTMLYTLSQNKHEQGARLHASQYPQYFQALEMARMIAATDARSDARTREFTAGYLVPFGITSMLDVPIWCQGRIIGLVCHEHTGPLREWTPEEQEFVITIADEVSLALQAEELKHAQHAVHKSEQRYRRAISQADLVPYQFDYATETYLFIGEGIKHLTGYANTEMTLSLWTEMIQEVKLRGMLSEMSLEEARRRIWSGELTEWWSDVRIKTRDGEVRWLTETFVQLLNPEGKPTGALGILQDITDRKRIEEKLEYQLKIEKLVAVIAAKFLDLSADNVDIGINWALMVLGEFTGADRFYLFLLSEDRTTMDNTHEWYAIGIEPQLDKLKNLAVSSFPWWMDKLNRFETIYIPKVAELPEEAAAEKAFLQAQNIQSLIVVPMVYEKTLFGFLGFDSVKTVKSWFDEDITLLEMVAELIEDVLLRQRIERALRDSETKYRSLVETSPDAITLTDTSGKIIITNQQAVQLHGFDSEQEFVGLNAFLLIVPEDRERAYRNMQKTLTSGSIHNIEYTLLKKDRTRFPAELSASVIKDDHGEPKYFVGITRDISTRKLLEKRNVMFAWLAHQLSSATKQKDIGQAIFDTAKELIGWDCCWLNVFSPTGQCYPVYAIDIVDGRHQETPATYSDDTAETVIQRTIPHGARLILRGVTPDSGAELRTFGDKVRRSASLMFVPVKSGGKIIGVLSIQSYTPNAYTESDLKTVEAIAEHSSSAIARSIQETELGISQLQLSELIRYLRNVKEKEQTRIARAIHDELGQTLTALKIDLITMQKNPPADKKKVTAQLTPMISLIDDSVQIAHWISSELRPGILDHLGLVDALEWRTQEFSNKTKIKYKLDLMQKPVPLNKEQITVLYRIFQELLTNIARHSSASKILVTLTCDRNNVILTVHDDGKGITETEIRDIKSLGILDIRERATSLGGTFDIRGIEGQGTTVTVKIPINK